MKKEKRINLLFIIGLLFTSGALMLNRYEQLPDFIKGLCYGIGIGLIILFVIKKSKEKKLNA